MSEPSHTRPGPVRPRSVEDFEEMYAQTPPWDVGHPQPALVELAERGLLAGTVLDVGCGSGEHALLAAGRGHAATGLDASRTAIGLARAKAETRGIAVRFVVGDALDLAGALGGERFGTIIDSALFHVFEDADRARYVAGLGDAVVPGGRYLMLCFSEHQPGDWGPRRVTEAEIRASFADGWTIEAVDPVTMDVTTDFTVVPAGVPSWRTVLRRR